MLNTVNKSPFERNTLDSCLRMAPKGSAILFFEDGVYAAQDGTAVSDKVKAAMGDFTLYVLGPDLRARGIDEGRIVDGIEVIDYDGFVDLAVEQGPVQSWL